LRLWAAQSVSAIGSRITRTAIPVIAVLAVDGSAVELGLLAACSVAPGALVALALGGWVDRSPKRRILIGADLVRAALVMTIPIAAWLGLLTIAQLYVTAAAIGCASALFQITDNAYLPSLIGKPHLVEGNSKLEATEAVAEITGPGLAGVLIEFLTAPVAMVGDAATFLCSALFLGRIRSTETPAASTGDDTLASDLRTGFRACWHEPRVRPLLLATAVSTLAGGFFFALYMLYSLDVLGLSPGVVGLIISVGGVSSVIGALISSRVARRLGTGRAMIGFLVLGQSAALLIPAATGQPWLVVAFLVAHQLLGDGLIVAYTIQAISLRQSVLPGEILARANAVFTAAESALLPIGALLAGAMGQLLGVRTALWVGLSIGLLAPLMLVPLRRLRSIGPPDDDPASR
jgi:predicted MFS family arabinose efflux permease